MKLDDYAAVKYFRNNPDRNAVGIVTLIVGIIVFALYGIGNLLPDYDESVILLEDSWTSYPVSIYGLMYEGYDVKIEYDVLEGERVDMFILDEKQTMDFAHNVVSNNIKEFHSSNFQIINKYYSCQLNRVILEYVFLLFFFHLKIMICLKLKAHLLHFRRMPVQSCWLHLYQFLIFLFEQYRLNILLKYQKVFFLNQISGIVRL